MDKKETIQYLRQCLGEIPNLAKLNYDNSKYPLWRNTITGVLEEVFGQNSIECKEFMRAGHLEHIHTVLDAFSNIHQEDYIKNLKSLGTAILSIIKKYEIVGMKTEPATKQEKQDNTTLPIDLFDKMQFHPRVIAASKSLFRDGHYASAILEAYKAVNNFVKEKTNLALDGKALMSKVFSEDAPIIKLNELLTQSDRDEQEGFKFLFMGAMVGIRNPKAHDNVIQTDPYRTLEYLGFASLLMKRIEEGKVVSVRKNV